MKLKELEHKIFEIHSDNEFNDLAQEIFHFQFTNNRLYREYIELNNIRITAVDHYHKIPFLPIELFKTLRVYSGDFAPEKVFLSSGTTGMKTSRHYVADLNLYEKSFLKCFNLFYGNPENYLILALLPSYLEKKDSSLIYMVEKLITLNKNLSSGFYLDNYDELVEMLSQTSTQKILLLGVTYALLNLAEKFEIPDFNGIVMETGGMKGRRKEIIREELHSVLKSGFHVSEIHSEYGMTELLSQAYSQGNGMFKTPPWMKVLIRDTNDPKSLPGDRKTGGINVIDLANIYSCSFVATQDLGKTYEDGSFEVLGRFDNSDIRGCNLLI